MFADRSHTTIGGQVSESYFHEIPDRQWQLLHGPSKFYQSLFGFVPCNAYFQLLSEKKRPPLRQLCFSICINHTVM